MNIQSTNFGQALQQMQKPALKAGITATQTESQDTFNTTSVKFGSKDDPGFVRRMGRIFKGKANKVAENVEDKNNEELVKLGVREDLQRLKTAAQAAKSKKNKAVAKENIQAETVAELEKQYAKKEQEFNAILDYLDILENGSEEEVAKKLSLHGKTLADRESEYSRLERYAAENEASMTRAEHKLNEQKELLESVEAAATMARAELEQELDKISAKEKELENILDAVEQAKMYEDIAVIREEIGAATSDSATTSENERLYKKQKERLAEAKAAALDDSEGEKAVLNQEMKRNAEVGTAHDKLKQRRAERAAEKAAEKAEQSEQKAEASGQGSSSSDPFDD